MGPTIAEAVRLRNCIAGPNEPTTCLLCGQEAFASNGAHALCCSESEMTKGHSRVAPIIHDVAAARHPANEPEARDIIPYTNLRPTDVLTRALGNGRHAFDVGI